MNNFKKNFYILSVFLIILLAIMDLYIFKLRFMVLKPMSDYEYKVEIVKSSNNPFYNVESLRTLAGEKELGDFIKRNSYRPERYTPTIDNIETGEYRATLHMHTTNSDGKATVKETLDKAQEYAKKYLPEYEYMYIAITDHNTVLGAKELIDVLEKHPFKYNKIRVAAGMEIFTAYNKSKIAPEPIQIHILLWCINPYDKFLNSAFHKANLEDKWNRKSNDDDFDTTIEILSDFGIVGIAHPARYNTHLGKDKYAYITEMLTKYKNLTSKPAFVEGYYQSYSKLPEKKDLGEEYDQYIKYIINEANRLGIYNTGSVDAHHHSIFRK